MSSALIIFNFPQALLWNSAGDLKTMYLWYVLGLLLTVSACDCHPSATGCLDLQYIFQTLISQRSWV